MSKRSKREKTLDKEGIPKSSGTSPLQRSKETSSINIVILVLAVTGILLTAYLTFTAYFQEHPAFCSEGAGCDIDQSSRWATFLTIPMT